MTSTELVETARAGGRPVTGQAATQLAFDLGADLTPTSLDLRDANLTYQDWENLGRAVGFVGNAWQWWVGDWLIAGETLFGEDAANAVEPTRGDRYDLARRITGKDQGTLMNIRSICARVLKENRREELDFTHHAKVSSLDPEEQAEWLQKAIDGEWSTSELAQAIKDSRGIEPPPNPDPDPGPGEQVSPAELRDRALALVYQQSQPLSDGDYRLPAEVYAQVGAALGEN